MKRDFISIADLAQADLEEIFSLARGLKADRQKGWPHPIMAGKTLAMIFEKPSLRTRVTFEAGMVQLGGYAIYLVITELAQAATIPVINGLSDLLHPCQVLADCFTLIEHRGSLDDLKVAFVGDGNNMVYSWFNAATKLPFRFVLACPPGYEPDPKMVEQAHHSGARISVTHTVAEAVREADAVYTDVWTSMGQEEEGVVRREAFKDYQVNADVMGLAKSDALVMHCLPAHRGEEIAAEVLDGPQSVVFDQSENRLHIQKAIMVWLLQ